MTAAEAVEPEEGADDEETEKVNGVDMDEEDVAEEAPEEGEGEDEEEEGEWEEDRGDMEETAEEGMRDDILVEAPEEEVTIAEDMTDEETADEGI